MSYNQDPLVLKPLNWGRFENFLTAHGFQIFFQEVPGMGRGGFVLLGFDSVRGMILFARSRSRYFASGSVYGVTKNEVSARLGLQSFEVSETVYLFRIDIRSQDIVALFVGLDQISRTHEPHAWRQGIIDMPQVDMRSYVEGLNRGDPHSEEMYAARRLEFLDQLPLRVRQFLSYQKRVPVLPSLASTLGNFPEPRDLSESEGDTPDHPHFLTRIFSIIPNAHA